jgi:hypothetical protein
VSGVESGACPGVPVVFEVNETLPKGHPIAESKRLGGIAVGKVGRVHSCRFNVANREFWFASLVNFRVPFFLMRCLEMQRRSLVLSLAAGLIASMAFTAQSHAATILVSESFTASADSPTQPIESVGVIFSGLNGVTNLKYLGISFDGSGYETPTLSSFTGGPLPAGDTEVLVTFATPVLFTATTVTFDTTEATQNVNLLAGIIKVAGFTVMSGPDSNSVGEPVFGPATAVPEAPTMGLLGIGMAGLLTYRRLTKRAAIA